MTPRRRSRGLAAALLSVLSALGGAGRAQAQVPVETIILSPEPGEQIALENLLVAISFIDPELRLDPASVRLTVGGVDVTSQATVEPQIITWVPLQALASGPQMATLTMRDRNGAELPPVAWSFAVGEPSPGSPLAQAGTSSGVLLGQAPIRGSVVFENTTASVSGAGAAERRDEEVLPRLWVNAGGAFLGGGWRYSARVHLSGYESSAMQPVNRYRLNVRSEHLDVTLGDANPYLQDLILQGRRVRGIQASLRTNGFGVTVVKGEDRRAIDGALNPVDPTLTPMRSGTFGRDIFAVRSRFGSGELFQLGLTGLRARDDVSSISALRTAAGPEGTSQSANPLPKDNLVLGTDMTLRLLSGRVLLQYENALSLLANDITGGALGRAQIDSVLQAFGEDPIAEDVDFDPLDWDGIFILNASLTPLDPSGLTNAAQQLRATITAAGHYLSAEYRSIGGAYYSLGNPSLQRDRKGYRIQDAFTLLDRTLALSGGFEWDRDNLADVKSATTTSSGVFADVNWQAAPNRPGVTASVRFRSRTNDLVAGEDGAVDETSRTLGLGVIYPVNLVEALRTRVNVNWVLLTREDPKNTFVGSRNHYYLAGISGETLDRRSQFSLTYGLNRSELTTVAGAHTDFHRLQGSGRRQLASRWAGLADGTLTMARTSDEALSFGLVYDRSELMLGGEFEWTPSSFVTFEAGIVSYSDDLHPARDTREVLTRLRVNRSF